MKLNEIAAQDDLSKVLKQVRKNCKSYIAQGKPPMWRGLNLDSSMIEYISSGLYMGTVRKDRKPKDSSKELHDIANKFFQKKIGIPIRSNSLFVTGSENTAGGYGDAYGIIPIGDFHYVWSPIINDLYFSFEESFPFNKDEPEFVEIIIEEANKFGVTLTDLMDTENHPKRLDIIKSIFDNHGDKLYLFDNDLTEACRTGHEVMILCDRYYIIKDNEIEGFDGDYSTFRHIL